MRHYHSFRLRIRCLASLALVSGTMMGSGCKSEGPDSTPTSGNAPTTTTEALPTASVSPASSAKAPVKKVVTAQPPAATVDCKSTAPGKMQLLGTRIDKVIATHPWGDRIYVLSHQNGMARTTLSYFNRDGSEKGTIGKYQGVGRPITLSFTTTHAYFMQHKQLMRFPLAGGKATVVAKPFTKWLTLYDGLFYGIRCGKNKKDHLVRVAESGGEPTVLATVDRKTNKCLYGGIAVDDRRAVITDFEGRRVISIALDSKKIETLASGIPYVRDIFLRKDSVDFSGKGGMYRIGKGGGKPHEFNMDAISPYGVVVPEGADYWLLSVVAYEDKEFIRRIRGASGKTEDVFTFFKHDVPSTAAEALSIDDQCIYFAQQKRDYMTVMSLRKPK